jgi:hypothetical protein
VSDDDGIIICVRKVSIYMNANIVAPMLFIDGVGQSYSPLCGSQNVAKSLSVVTNKPLTTSRNIVERLEQSLFMSHNRQTDLLCRNASVPTM